MNIRQTVFANPKRHLNCLALSTYMFLAACGGDPETPLSSSSEKTQSSEVIAISSIDGASSSQHSIDSIIESEIVEAEAYHTGSRVEPFTPRTLTGRVAMIWDSLGQTNNDTSENANGQLHYRLTATSANLTLFATINFSSADNDSFYFKLEGVDSGWKTFNNVQTNGFEESQIAAWASLQAGSQYTLKILRREDGAMIDAFRLEGGKFKVGANDSSTSSHSSMSSSSSNSSLPMISSSNSSSSVSSQSNSSQSNGNSITGAGLYKQHGCASCHGADGIKNEDGTPALFKIDSTRVTYKHSTDAQSLSLAEYIDKFMPPGKEAICDQQCARDLAAYIRGWPRASDGTPDNPVSAYSCKSSQSVGFRTLRPLTKAQYIASVSDLVGFNGDVWAMLPSDLKTGSFWNNNELLLDKGFYLSYLVVAEKVAKDAASRWNSVIQCDPNNNGEACAQKLVNDLAPRIFRRPLTETEKSKYLNVANGSANSVTAPAGMEIALTAMLSSPQFIYRSEVGEASGNNGLYKLTPYEIATYLSYTYTGSTPTQNLLGAAQRGELDNSDGVLRHAKLLLDSPSARELLEELPNLWLDTDRLENSPKQVPFADIANDMKKELGKNFASAMLENNGNFSALYEPGYSFLNQRLAQHYGISLSGDLDADGFTKANTSERGGILLSGAFLSRYAHAEDANLITRAVAIRRKLLCQDIPEPPAGVSLDRDTATSSNKAFLDHPNTTQRMKFEKLTEAGVCADCHTEIINPLGAGLEDYDTLARIRSTGIKGNPVDSTGVFFSPYPQLQFYSDPDRVIENPPITFDGGQELAGIIARNSKVSELAQTCLSTQMMSYAVGVHSAFLIDSDRDVGFARISTDESDAYRCDIERLTQTLRERGPRAMLEGLGNIDSVLYRKEWAR